MQTYSHAFSQPYSQTAIQTDSQTNKQTNSMQVANSHTERQSCREPYRQTGIQIKSHTDKQLDTEIAIHADSRIYTKQDGHLARQPYRQPRQEYIHTDSQPRQEYIHTDWQQYRVNHRAATVMFSSKFSSSTPFVYMRCKCRISCESMHLNNLIRTRGR